jgi:hypothetical protein
MEKDFKSLKFDLLVYRHIYLIYAILIALLVALLVNAIINKHETWYLVIQSGIIIFLVYISIFRLRKERLNIKLKADAFLLTLTSLEASMKSRIAKLLVLENEFDILKEKENGVKLIQDRIANIHISSIEDGINTAINLGGEPNGAFITSFSVPDTISELYELVKDMKSGAEKDKERITMMLETINKLAKKF